jgi:hypothetical protein
MTKAMTAAIRWISGRRSDGGDDQRDAVIAIVHAPQQQPTGEYATQVFCRFLRWKYIPVLGGTETQCTELAIGLVCHLFVHRGVREIVVSLTPPDETGAG